MTHLRLIHLKIPSLSVCNKKFHSSLTFTWNLNASLLELVSVSALKYLWLWEFLTSYTHGISEFWRIMGAPQYQQPLWASLTHYGEWNSPASPASLPPSYLPSFLLSSFLPSPLPPLSTLSFLPSFIFPPFLSFSLLPPLPSLLLFLVKNLQYLKKHYFTVYELTELTKSKISKLTQILIGYTVSVIGLARTC